MAVESQNCVLNRFFQGIKTSIRYLRYPSCKQIPSDFLESSSNLDLLTSQICRNIIITGPIVKHSVGSIVAKNLNKTITLFCDTAIVECRANMFILAADTVSKQTYTKDQADNKCQYQHPNCRFLPLSQVLDSTLGIPFSKS